MRESKIKRLVDSLPDQLFETSDREKMKVGIIQQISGSDLDNFIGFLNPDVQEPPWEANVSSRSHSSPTTEVILGTSGSKRREVDDDVSDAEGNREAKDRSRREAQSNEDFIDKDRIGITGISDKVERELECLLSLGVEASLQGSLTNRYTDIWSLGRVVNEKFSDSDNIIGSFLSLNRRLNPKLPSFPSEKRVLQFTLHLENIFATYGGRESVSYPETPNDEDQDHYYNELCRRSRTPRRVFEKDNVKPQCAFESYYWELWKLPRCLPPAFGDVDIQKCLRLFEKNRIGGLKFIGYMMEIVRNGLAKWTEKTVGEAMDTELWSPTLGIPSANVEFDASDEFRKRMMGDIGFYFLYNKNGRPSEALCVHVLWECQKYLVEAINSNVYGPSNLELVLLCILGFPALTVEVGLGWTFTPRRFLQSHNVRAEISISAVGDNVRIRMDLTLIDVSGLALRNFPFKFIWAEWIHSFEACMKVLTYDYDEGELSEARTDKVSVHHDLRQGEPSSDAEFVTNCAEEGSSKGDSVAMHERGAIVGDTEDQIERAEGGNKRDSITANENASDEKDATGMDEQHVKCSCKRNRYRLNQRGKRIYIKGTQKYFWEWEGWKAQEAFGSDRYPILYEESSNVGGENVEQETPNSRHETRLPIQKEDEAVAAGANEPLEAPPKRE
ncbi:hypothetical protein FGB62_27g26 [Gracilaria domingensis]|nr:hypothetical protein FGB62_27g26 [Gracilaria domingensis]